MKKILFLFLISLFCSSLQAQLPDSITKYKGIIKEHIYKEYKGMFRPATVRIYPEEKITGQNLNAYLNASSPWKTGQIAFKQGDKKFGKHYIVENVSGNLVVSW